MHGLDVEEYERRQGNSAQRLTGLNANLVKADTYTKLDQKLITAWLDLRNKAAHGKYDEYTADRFDKLIVRMSLSLWFESSL